MTQAFLFLVSGLALGLLAVFFSKFFGHYIHRHIAISVGVGLAVALVFWLLKLIKRPPLFLKRVSPWLAGLCAGLGVHISRLWIH